MVYARKAANHLLHQIILCDEHKTKELQQHKGSTYLTITHLEKNKGTKVAVRAIF